MDGMIFPWFFIHTGQLQFPYHDPRTAWLLDLTAQIISSHTLTPGDDPLRPKDWLHLSLAYDIDDTGPFASLAKHLVDPTASACWEVAVWERFADNTWTRHTARVHR